MEVIILCGGTGTRLKEMTEFLPKPMIPIGGRPMIRHIMERFEHYGHLDFILALGYKQEVFKQYFAHYDVINEDVMITSQVGPFGRRIKALYDGDRKPTNIILTDTGPDTLKGGRLKKV